MFNWSCEINRLAELTPGLLLDQKPGLGDFQVDSLKRM